MLTSECEKLLKGGNTIDWIARVGVTDDFMKRTAVFKRPKTLLAVRLTDVAIRLSDVKIDLLRHYYQISAQSTRQQNY